MLPVSCFRKKIRRPATFDFCNTIEGKAAAPTRERRGSFDPSVWTGRALQAESDDLEKVGLALLYPALEWNMLVPGHDGYPRASDLILGKALKGQSGHQIRDVTARPFSISSFRLADLGGKANSTIVLGVSLSRQSFPW